ncbi:hypothetical protein FB645_000818 [Coemansia sp. IMI 203386]|nr:hypothetical protein FB645_000818 [Coemansia sp. IMI 203386]
MSTGSGRANWWDQAPPSANSGPQDWSEYYQSLESFHSRPQTQPQQVNSYDANVNSYQNYAPAEESAGYAQWYYQNYPQQRQIQQHQQHQQPYGYQHQYQQYQHPSHATTYSANESAPPVHQHYPHIPVSSGFSQVPPSVNGGHLGNSNGTLPGAMDLDVPKQGNVHPYAGQSLVGPGDNSSDSSASTAVTKGVTRGVSDISLLESGNRNRNSFAATTAIANDSWRANPTERKPLYSAVQVPKKGKASSPTKLRSETAISKPITFANKVSKPKSKAKTFSKANAEPEWPDSLREFVERSFKACSSKARPNLEKQLQQIISAATTNKKLNVINWDVRPLPKACDLVSSSNKPIKGMTLSAKRSSVSAGLGNSFEDFDSAERKARRLLRFQQEAAAAEKAAAEAVTVDISPSQHMHHVHEWDADTIVGTCAKLEKSYLRLTSAPDPSQVRPLPVLHKTLELLKRKWLEDSNYTYICDQFKSLRQDLTVQRITNDFTVEVYELHARIALETNDLGEYNQCQTQLKQLYSMGLSGHSMEFLAYRILYFLYTRNKADIVAALAVMTPDEKRDAAVQHALLVRKAMAQGNYHAFFKLYINAPNMGGYLMDNFVDRERCIALQKMCKAFRPKLGLDVITKELAFEDVEPCVKFLTGLNIVTTVEGEHLAAIDMKAAYPYAIAAMQKYNKVDIKGQIY